MDEEFIKAEILFEEGQPREALSLVNALIKKDTKNVEYLFLRAKISYRLQHWGEALNDLNIILDYDPGNQIASNYKTMVQDIISFWNKDNYNP